MPLSPDERAELIRQESFAGRLPLRLSEREYSIGGAHSTCFAYAVATWCFLTGGIVAQFVGAVQGVVCLIAGNLLGVFLVTMSLSLGCQRYGIEQIDFCKPAFGQRGAKIVLIFYVINMVGWSGLILVMFGNGIRNIAGALGYDFGNWIVGVGVSVGIWLTYLIVTRGVHLLNLSNKILTPGIFLLVGFMFYVLFSRYGWTAIASAAPLEPLETPALNYLIALELGVASGLSWWGGIGFIARNTRSQRGSIYPEIVQLGFSGAVVCCVALFSALVIKSIDPTDWMIPIGGLFIGILALIFVAFANITSTAVSMFATGLALRHIPLLKMTTWRAIVLVSLIPCIPFVFWPQELYGFGDTFLAYNGTMHAPIAGILFVDFFFLRRERLSLWAIFDDSPDGEYYYSRGFNWPALLSLVLGQATYFYLYNPFTSEVSELGRLAPASIAACLLPALTYWIAMRLHALRQPPTAMTGSTASDEAGRRLIQPNI
jgi:NCS1 family nucleobase:cation symporter-1